MRRVVHVPPKKRTLNIMRKFLMRKYTMIFRYVVIFRWVLGLTIRVHRNIKFFLNYRSGMIDQSERFVAEVRLTITRTSKLKKTPL